MEGNTGMEPRSRRPNAGARSGEGTAGRPGRGAPEMPETEPHRRVPRWLLIIALIVLAAIAAIVLRPYFAPPARIDMAEPPPE